MRKYFLFIILLTGSLLFGREISLAEAEQLALKNNLQIKISELSLERSLASRRETRSNFFPTVNSFYQLTNNLELPVVVIDIDGDGPLPPQELKMGSDYSSTAGIQLAYPVFTGSAIISGQLIASSAVNLSELSLQEQVNTVLYTIRVLYYQIQMLESMIDATEQGLLSAKENYELALKRKSVGQGTQLDVLQAKVRYESYKPQLVSLKNQLVSAKSNLMTYMNDPDMKDIRVSGALEQVRNPYTGFTIKDLQEITLNERLELQMADEQKKIAAYQRNIAWSSIMPKVQIASSVQWQSNVNALSDLDHRRNSNVSLSVSLPLFTGGKSAAGIQKAAIGVKEAHYQKDQIEDFVLNDVDAAYRKVEEMQSNIDATENVVKQAEEALRLSKLLYETGSATQLDLMTAESGFIGAKSNYISSVFQYNVAVEGLKKALNNLLTYHGE
ncbi:MAG: TolC family protein [FCB group bacterium]|nr:TolC family protein [FCB group bacterium]